MTDSDLDVRVHHRLGRIDLNVHLAVGRETLALIGPSGAGKSSVLRTITGLLTPKEGRIVCAGRVLLDRQRHVNLPPEEREVGMVFQDGALFPHLTVAKNVGYGLRPRPRSRRERRAQVAEILERFAIAPLAAARPARISGGERQRVAIARAVASSPSALLLDEPLSALDAVTKSRIAAELSRVLTALRLPTILVSHDLADVAGLADRVAVMDAGRIVQVGSIAELVRAPASAFVAAFVGTNYFAGEARRVGGLTEVDLDDGARVVSGDAVVGRVGAVVPPWRVTIGDPASVEPGGNAVIGAVTSVAPRGGALRVTVAGKPVVVADVPADTPAAAALAKGTIVAATWPYALTRLIPESESSDAG